MKPLQARLGLPSLLYAARVAAGELNEDPAQTGVLKALDETYSQVTAPTRRRWWRRGRQRLAAAGSLYLYGPVGRGKSLLMNLMVEALSAQGSVKRVHFHAFMLDTHRRLHALQRAGGRQDPLDRIAEDLAKDSPILCFDEFVVNNIADAMILGRLFAALWAQGLTIIATSNFAPDDLYKDGLQRDRFVPFIELIKLKMRPLHLAGPRDYRRLQSLGARVFFHPLTSTSRLDFEDAYKRLAGDALGSPLALQIGSRHVSLPWAAPPIAMARFADLCERPLGAADYLALTQSFTVLALDQVPILVAALRNEASRFKVLIDTLYEAGTLLILRTAAPFDHLYDRSLDVELSRTFSRLSEMRGQAYVENALARLDPAVTSGLISAEETAGVVQR